VPVVVAPPDRVALASGLERRIAAQSAQLDQLSDQYNKAQATADAAAQRLTDLQSQLADAEASATQAQVQVDDAKAALRKTALSAYLGVELAPRIKLGDLQSAYDAGIRQVYSNTAVGKVSNRVKGYHSALQHLQDAQQQIEQDSQQALAENTAAQAASLQAKTALLQAADQQSQLVQTVGQVQGDLVALVAAARAQMSQAIYNRLANAGSLDFKPSGPLPPQLPQTAQAIKIATAQLGKPYVWGATGPDSFDCSGLMQWSWAQLGVGLPRVAADQQAWVIPVPISQVLPGDLVFFGNPAHHVGMYIGNGMMVDAPHSGAYVEEVSVWWDELAGFGRVHL
jgi:cell wall-associated NlpC family hydrolase